MKDIERLACLTACLIQMYSFPLCLDEEEEDEEALTPLSPPPTLSITEEILEFINQSRAREGLTAIHTDTVVSIHYTLLYM